MKNCLNLRPMKVSSLPKNVKVTSALAALFVKLISPTGFASANENLPDPTSILVSMDCDVTGRSFNIYDFEKGYRHQTSHPMLGKAVRFIIEDSDFKGKDFLKSFSYKDPVAFWLIDIASGEKILSHISGMYSDDLRNYPSDIFTGEEFGSSVALAKTSEGVWKGRAISSQGVVEKNGFDLTIYLALTCTRTSEEGLSQ